ncbi:MAG: 4a-hydroxytetrahydrobiopterin dehydratase [Opitutales bacterium]
MHPCLPVLLLAVLSVVPTATALAQTDRSPLTTEQTEQALADLPGWEMKAKRLVRDYRFDSYPAMIAFLVRSAFVFEAEDHHPDAAFAYQGGYLVLSVTLGTHDAGGVATPVDVRVAGLLNDLSDPAQP